MKFNTTRLWIVAFVFTLIGLPFLADHLQPPDPVISYTIVDKMESYVQHKYSILPTYLLLIRNIEGVESTVNVSAATHYRVKVGESIAFTSYQTPWAVYLLMVYLVIPCVFLAGFATLAFVTGE